ncbi:penicillin-binding protein [Pedobacter polaris]|uniref:Penicillin-binding protein n=1 Tax=Pedobacter polaris TaxID=2571273 RepID=A0A4U1CWQ6_9SPHI|nr:biosynthetic peptidoglycan transglycosylase [Pedobacter polaris]TKC12700.1 penicillin-binding protein [Pedobacter polaris]
MQLPKIKIPKKYLKIGAWVLGVFLLLFISVGVYAYSKREALLKKMMAKAISKADKDYGLKIKIGYAGFSGLSTVNMKEISVVPKDRDTLSTIDDITIGVKLFPLIFGNVKLSEINLNKGSLNVVLKDTLTNLDFILKRKKKDSATTTKSKVALSDLANELLNEVLYKIPDDMEVKDFVMKLNDNDTASLKFLTTTATIDGGDLKSTIVVNDTAATWHVNGKVNPGRRKFDMMLFADGHKKVELPYLERKLHTKVSFDTVRTQMEDADYSGDDFKISGSWSVKNLLINQPRISATDVIIPDAKVDADMLIGENYICLDSTSTVFLKQATVHPYLKYTLSPNKIYEMKINAEEQDAQAIFDSFPLGLFESLEGMQVSGKLKYNLDFYLDTSIPDSVKFESTLTPTNFKIVKWGKTDLQKINSDFIYTPYEYGKPMRNITIGPSNPNFTRLGEISDNFKNALLTSEDPSFFRHKGFVEESIRKSIAVNFKEKRFKRGGSTISMQLVKNVFLSRQKTLARKAEEILIVWLIENNKLISKQRMLEVYFNIIEMGRNVYGIGEAAQHYFGKNPSELTIGEGIFLANIVPKPKSAMYKFMSDGSLKPYLLPWFRFIGGTMARRGLTPSDSSGYGFYNVRLREGLRQYLLPDSIVIDTNKIEMMDEDEAMPPGGMQDQPKNLFDRLFSGKKDTVIKVVPKTDTVKTRKQLRQERREQKRKENEDGG